MCGGAHISIIRTYIKYVKYVYVAFRSVVVTGSPPYPGSELEPINVALAVEVHAKARQSIYALFAGSVTFDTQTAVLALTGTHDAVILEGLSGVPHPPGMSTVNVGDSLGLIGAEGITVWHTPSALENTRPHPPRFVRASE